MEKINTARLLMLLGLYCLPLTAVADSPTASAQKEANQSNEAASAKSGARFMLSTDTKHESGNERTALHAADFEWVALTKNGPANGSEPMVGKVSGKTFYDFKDGQPFPYFVAPSAQSK